MNLFKRKLKITVTDIDTSRKKTRWINVPFYKGKNVFSVQLDQFHSVEVRVEQI